MRFFLPLLSFVLLASAHAEETSTSLFEQMKDSQPTKGLLKNYQKSGDEITVEIESKNSLGQTTTTTIKLCNTTDNSKTEVWRANEQNRQLETLKAAKESKAPIDVTTQGPWSPCLKLAP